MKSRSSLLAGTPAVINIGLRGFATDLAARGVPVAHVDWRPPAPGRAQAMDVLSWLSRFEGKIKKANEEGLRRMFAADPTERVPRPPRRPRARRAVSSTPQPN